MSEPLSGLPGEDQVSALYRTFERLISSAGPISLAHYFAESNARYYSSRDPLGGAGDFVTAPEISQMFGELIGLWLADIWTRAGKPLPVHYVELGPGRGTLAYDALKAARRFGLQTRPHFVEASDPLKALQAKRHPDGVWHADLTSLPEDAPLLIVANEFLDALPIRQLVRTGQGWRERMVGLHEGCLAPVAGSKPMDAAVPAEFADAPEGAIVETSPASAAIMAEVASRLTKQGGAALFIDYGHASPRLGSTLQAVRSHQKVDPFAVPGEADLTANVDFSAMLDVACANGARVLGTIEQGTWLQRMGIEVRAQALSRAAPDQAEVIHIAANRLVNREEMGALFKVMGLVGTGWPDGAAF